MSFQSFVGRNMKRTHKIPYFTLTSTGCRLSHGKVLTRLFKLWEEVMLFAHSSDKLYDRIHKIQIACKVGILGWYFQHSIISAWRCKERPTIFNVQDRIQVTRLRMELWCGRLDCRGFDRFTSLKTAADFFVHPGESEDGCTVALFNQHLRDPHSNLGRYFPEMDASFRSPFWDKNHTSSKSAPRFHQERSTALGTLMGHWRQRSGRKVWLGFGSTLRFLSWLVLLWSCWCHSKTTYNCEVGFSTLVGLKSKQRYQINVDWYESENPKCVVQRWAN